MPSNIITKKKGLGILKNSFLIKHKKDKNPKALIIDHNNSSNSMRINSSKDSKKLTDVSKDTRIISKPQSKNTSSQNRTPFPDSSSSEQKKGVIKSKNKLKRSNKNIKNKKRGWFMFGLGSFLSISIFYNLIALVIEIYIFSQRRQFSIQNQNLTDVAMLGTVSWISFNKIITSGIDTVLWNNQHTLFREGQASLEAFEKEIAFFRTNIIQNFTKLLNSDLGDFSDEFQAAMLTNKACGSIALKNPQNETIYCSELYGGALNQGILSSMMEIVQLTEEMVARWKVIRDSGSDPQNKKLLEVLRSNTFLSLHGLSTEFIKNTYYYITDSANAVLIKTIKQDFTFNTTIAVYFFYFRLGLMIYYLFYISGVSLTISFRNLTTPFRLISPRVLSENRYLINILLK